VTVIDTVWLNDPELTVMVAVPTPTAVTNPEGLTVATLLLEVVHVAELSGCVLESLYEAVALS
jgi:hypothetical protein